MIRYISGLILAVLVLAGDSPVRSQHTQGFNGFELVDKQGNIRLGCHIPAKSTDWTYVQGFPVLKSE